jgi:hypothetical protein
VARGITLIVGVAVIALTLAVPPAFGHGRYGGSHQRVDFWNYESGAKVSESSPGVAPSELALLFSSIGTGIETGPSDGAPELAQLLVAKNGVVDRSVTGALDASSGSFVDETAGSGTAIASARVGVGLGIGIILVLGLGLAMRIAHVRPFAH